MAVAWIKDLDLLPPVFRKLYPGAEPLLPDRSENGPCHPG
jgi:hypothetical protein